MTQHSLSFLSRWGREPDSTSNSSATLMNSQSNQPDCMALIICNLQLMLHTTETCANLSWYGVREQRNTAKDLWIPTSLLRSKIASMPPTSGQRQHCTEPPVDAYRDISCPRLQMECTPCFPWVLFKRAELCLRWSWNQEIILLTESGSGCCTFPCVEGNLL